MAKKRLFQFTDDLMTEKQLKELVLSEFDAGCSITEVQAVRKFKVKFDKDWNLVIPEAK